MIARRLALLLGVMASLACVGQTNDGAAPGSDSGNGGPSPVNPGVGAPPGGGPGGPGGSGSGSPGTGGSSGGGGLGTGGSAAGSGGSPGSADAAGPPQDAGAGMGPDGGAPAVSACTMTLIPLSPQRWLDLPAGEAYTLRVEARVSGGMLPDKPAWRWVVTQGGRQVATIVRDGDPAVREFATSVAGRYDISAEILRPDAQPLCAATAVATAIVPTQRVTKFRIRATPGPMLGRRLANLEVDVPVNAGMPTTEILAMRMGREIVVLPQDENGSALRSYYVRVTARRSTDRFEAYVDSSQATDFRPRVDIRHPDEAYDVSVVPYAVSGPILPPAQIFPGLTADRFYPLTDFKLDPGVAISGVTSVDGTPLADARIRLRAGMLTSTVGHSDMTGAFNLRARAGRFEVRVLPPVGSGLPDALLPESSGLVVTQGLPQQLSLRYAPLATALLDLRVLTPDGAAPTRPVEVLLETVEGALPDVGTFTLPGGATATAIGSLRATGSTSAGGLRFDKLPRARYRATIIPPEDLPGNLAITTVDFPVDGPGVTQTVTLRRRSRINGRLIPAESSRGLTVRGLDMGQDGARRVVTAVVDAEGSYQLPVDPDRVYRLSVEPAPARKLPRIPLVPVRARDTDVEDVQRLPAALPVTGRVLDATLATGQELGGVVIQIFCLGNAPDCIDPTSPDLSNTPPIDETVSASDGSYQLHVPDPGL